MSLTRQRRTPKSDDIATPRDPLGLVPSGAASLEELGRPPLETGTGGAKPLVVSAPPPTPLTDRLALPEGVALPDRVGPAELDGEHVAGHVRLLTNINTNETVVLYPTFGHLVDGGRTWRISVTGTVYESSEASLQHRILLRLLRRFMRVDATALDSALFQERIRGFTAATESGKQVAVRVGRKTYRLQKKSRRNGRFAGVLRIPVDDALAAADTDELNRAWIRMHVISPHGPTPQFLGQAQLIDDQGVSVISDIDDTIKHSHVICRRTLLANTFLNEFETIGGMATRYQQWAGQGAAFHYVSSSPWQLYGPLAELREASAFPAGTFHLRSFRLRDHMLRRLLLIRRYGKGAVIRELVRTFPNRKFVLVGDSGERDPDLYGDVARRHPDQVAGIFIRQVPQRPMTPERVARSFRNIPSSRWLLFEDGEQLPPLGPVETLGTVDWRDVSGHRLIH